MPRTYEPGDSERYREELERDRSTILPPSDEDDINRMPKPMPDTLGSPKEEHDGEPDTRPARARRR